MLTMDDFKTLPELFDGIQHQACKPAFYQKTAQGWAKTDWDSFLSFAHGLAAWHHAAGVKSGQSVGVVGPSGCDWLAADFANQFLGAVTVPMFVQLTREVFEHEIRDSDMRHIVVIGDEAVAAVAGLGVEFASITVLGSDHSAKNSKKFIPGNTAGSATNPVSNPCDPEQLATIIYTSGSTGMPKGVELTHANLVSQIKGCQKRFILSPENDVVLSCLPLAHIYERMIMYFYISRCLPIYFVRDIQEVGEDMRSVRPTIMTIVPRLLEKVHGKIVEKINAGSLLKRLIGRWALRLAQREQDEELKSSLSWRLADRLVFKNMRLAFGGRLKMAISGGAALSRDLNVFFLNVGIPLYQGYGLTESAPVLACNYPGSNEAGTVGEPFPGVELKIGTDGEILARGPNIMRGYHNHPEATAASLADGWLHTGDSGMINKSGRLVITGRIKELFKTSGGKYVSPVPIEQALCQHHLVDMAMVIAEGKKFVSVLLFPDLVQLKKFAMEHGLGNDAKASVDNPIFRRELEKMIDDVNSHLSDWEKIVRYEVIPDTVTVQEGLLTPTMKIKRHAISKKYKQLIDSMYN